MMKREEIDSFVFLYPHVVADFLSKNKDFEPFLKSFHDEKRKQEILIELSKLEAEKAQIEARK